MTQNILITSISSKTSLIQRVKDATKKYNKNMKVIGSDINPNVVGAYFTDNFWKMPKIKELKPNEIIDYCKNNNIAYIIPTSDNDVVYFSKHKQKFLDKNIHVFVSEYQSVSFCFDKLKFYEDSGIDWCIKTSLSIKNITSDFYVLKERFGSGSRNIAIGVSKKEALKIVSTLHEAIFQPFIQGIEYSIDSYIDKSNNLIGSIIRSRDVVRDGESKVTTVVEDDILSKKVKKFLQKHKIQGHSVLQVIKRDKEYYLIECNARFGGASTLSYELGLESFYWFLQESNNQDIKANISKKSLKQVRCSKDIFFEN